MRVKFLNLFVKTFSWLSEKIARRIDYMSKMRVVSLKSEQPLRGNALLSYRIEPFFLKAGESFPNDHTWYWECQQIAQTFLDLGYNVDVIQFHNQNFVPRKNYDFFIDIRHRLEALAPILNKDCIKIFHADTAHIIFHNAAECGRLLALQQRKGIVLSPRRLEILPNLGAENADCIVVLGNEFTINTFKYANRPIYRIPISTPLLYPWPSDKDFDACRQNFLWFGSGGMVHKGLDLLLDAFAEMPEYHLTICGPVENEEDFVKAFRKELYETPNIHLYGWVDISSKEFTKIAQSCIGLIYPSCSEGGGGSVITCMHAGLIPIVSYESSVDISDEYGVILHQSSVAEIKDSIRMISALDSEKLENMSKKSWEFARANHTREKFAANYRHFVEQIISEQSHNQQTIYKHMKQAAPNFSC